MDLGLFDKVALVCGASKGLGRAIADRLAGEGCKVAICARGSEGLARARDEIARTGAEVHAISADVSVPSEVTELVTDVLARFGRIDVLVTNSGGPKPGSFDALSDADWDAATRLLLGSVVGLCRAVLPGMRERAFGRIVNITSIAVRQPGPNLMLSTALRAAVTGFARSLADEVAGAGITVNNVLPGFTRTARLEELADSLAAREGVTREEVVARWEREIPSARLGRPEEIAAVVAFLASTPAGYVTGTSVAVDGGWLRALW